MIVVDTNVVAYAVLVGERTPLVRRLAAIDPEWIAPRLWRREMANVLATKRRSTDLPLAEAVAAFEIAELMVTEAENEPSIAEILELAERGGISAYDAEFVAVAEQLGRVLVTADRRLARAFPGRVRTIEEFVAAGADSPQDADSS